MDLYFYNLSYYCLLTPGNLQGEEENIMEDHNGLTLKIFPTFLGLYCEPPARNRK